MIPMDPKLIHALLADESNQDILTPAVAAERRLFADTKCPVCRSSGCEKKLVPPKIVETEQGPHLVTSPFSDVLPDGHAHCRLCNTDFNPLTGMIYQSGAPILSLP